MAIRNIFLLLSCVAGLVVSEDFDKKNVPTEVLHYLEKEINHELDASQFARIVKIDEYRVVKDRHFHITVTVQDSTCTKEHVSVLHLLIGTYFVSMGLLGWL